jgi:hypothetical protein
MQVDLLYLDIELLILDPPALPLKRLRASVVKVKSDRDPPQVLKRLNDLRTLLTGRGLLSQS